MLGLSSSSLPAIRDRRTTWLLKALIRLLPNNQKSYRLTSLKSFLNPSPTTRLQCDLHTCKRWSCAYNSVSFSAIRTISSFSWDKPVILFSLKWLTQLYFFLIWRQDNSPPPFKCVCSIFKRPVLSDAVVNSWSGYAATGFTGLFYSSVWFHSLIFLLHFFNVSV